MKTSTIAAFSLSTAIIAAFFLWPPGLTLADAPRAEQDIDNWAVPVATNEPATPEIPEGTVIPSLDKAELLQLLYGRYDAKSGSKATIIQSIDFRENGKKKHVLIANLSDGAYSPFLSAHVFAWTKGKWIAEANYPHLERLVGHYPQSAITWRQIGSATFGIQEEYAEHDIDYSTAELNIYAKRESDWRRVLGVVQRVVKGESVAVRLSFKQGKQPFWNARLKTTINSGKPLTMRYVYLEEYYVEAGTLPPMGIEQAMHTRGLPATDWDGEPVDLRKKITSGNASKD